MKFQYLLLFTFLIFSTGCGNKAYNYLSTTKTGEEIKETSNKLEKVFYMFVGHFSNEEQARQLNSPVYRAQEMMSVPIWTKRSGEYWAYVSWMMADNPNILMTQEVLEFKRFNTDTIELKIYDVPESKKKKYEKDREWKKKEPLIDLEPKDLVLAEGCTAYITRDGNSNKFLMKGTPCSRNISDDIKFYRTHSKLTPTKIAVHSEMLGADKKEIVISYESLGIQFERTDKENPKYLNEDD